jgi:hypothetical protein
MRAVQRVGSAVVALAVVTSVAAVEGDFVPWPLGVPPSEEALVGQLEDADALFARERSEEFLEARERGEDAGHIKAWQADIDAGLYEPDTLFRVGDALFAHEFRNEDGLSDRPNARLQRVHDGVRGGLDTYSCSGCHSQGGANGAGAPTQNAFVLGDGVRIESAAVRNSPHVLGVGITQILATEMTTQLRIFRDRGLEDARLARRPIEVELSSKGISFGAIVAHPNGWIDYSGLSGIDRDLEVKPFGWKGDVARLRDFITRAVRIHFGIQADEVVALQQNSPAPELLGDGPWYDPDDDGIEQELEAGTVTAGAVYLAMLETPVVLPPNDSVLRGRWATGSSYFDDLGCSSCHVRSLELGDSRWREKPAGSTSEGFALDLYFDGDAPRPTPDVELFSDLKRHDMGPDLADPVDHPMGIPRSHFLTRPLWGLAETAPFLHDGRAPTLHEAIELHGGEASESRDAYRALDVEAQRDLHIFLLSLTRNPRLRVQP